MMYIPEEKHEAFWKKVNKARRWSCYDSVNLFYEASMQPVELAIVSERMMAFISKEKNRQHLHGIWCDGSLSWATDGERYMARRTIDQPCWLDKKGVRHAATDVSVNKHEAGQYPLIRQCLVKSYASEYVYDAASLRALCDMAKLYWATLLKHSDYSKAELGPPLIQFTFTDSGIAAVLYEQSLDKAVYHPSAKCFGAEARGHVDRLMRITVNAAYLKAALDKYDGPVSIYFLDDYSPIEIHREDGERHGIMPFKFYPRILEKK